MQFAKPHNTLERLLKDSGIIWSSVLNVKDWERFWNEGLIPSELEQDFRYFFQWLEKGAHGDMAFLNKNHEARKNPKKILEKLSSIISLVIPYSEGQTTHRKNKTEIPESKGTIFKKTARYARVPDYHRAIKKELDSVMRAWVSEAVSSQMVSSPIQWRVATDSIPFLDRAHARLAGLGFIGKNTMLIRPGIGSYFFIAHILTDAPFEVISDSEKKKPIAASAISELNCGDCTRCIDACPTSALQAPMQLNSNLCLSYLTIENRKTIDKKFIPHLSDQFYGCDICQAVCPYNLKTTPLHTIKQFEKFHPPLLELSLVDVALMDKKNYERWFGGSPMTRAKYSGLVRNALYALFAIGDKSINEILKKREHDPEPLISQTVEHIINLSRHLDDHDQQ